MSSSTQVNLAPLDISISPISVQSTGPVPDSVLELGFQRVATQLNENASGVRISLLPLSS
jgi:hypothetical protein